MVDPTSERLATLVLRAVLSVYFAVIITVTALQLTMEYIQTKNDITQELVGLENIFSEPLTATLWAATQPQIEALANGITKLPIVTGIEVINEASGLNVTKFLNKKSELFHSFQLFYTFEKNSVYLATVTVYSDSSVVFNRLKVGFFLLIVQILVISVVMTLLFIWAIKKFLKIPLLQFVDEIENASVEKKEGEQVNFNFNAAYVEFQPLVAVLKKMGREIAKQIQFIKKLNEDLEIRVRQRTADLVSLKDAAESANRAKSIFLANMSHELRTPLNAVLGFSQLMRNDLATTGSQRENLDIISRSGEHLLSLINDVLVMSKIEAGRIILKPEDFDLGSMILAIMDTMNIRAEAKGLQLTLDQSSDFPRYIHADRVKLHQMLINLLGNAIKCTNEGSIALRLGATPTEDSKVRLACEVKDSGIGIAEEDLGHIFEPFIQAGEQTDAKGTGLGLAITKQYVELMGGELSVESKVGKGSVFRFEISVERAVAEEIGQTEPSRGRVIGLEPDQPSWRILIVEDQLENRLLLKKLLEQVGFEVREAVNGQKAIQLFEAWRPHFIWMDRRMPEMGGITATRRIKAMEGGKKTIIVVLTASVFEEQRDEVLEAGCDDFLRKPFREAEIFDMMAKHLKAHYIYAEEQPTTTAEAARMDLPSSEAMAALPAEWLAVLARAAEEIDLKAAEQIISRIDARNKELAESLTYLVKEFRFDILQDLIKETME